MSGGGLNQYYALWDGLGSVVTSLTSFTLRRGGGVFGGSEAHNTSDDASFDVQGSLAVEREIYHDPPPLDITNVVGIEYSNSYPYGARYGTKYSKKKLKSNIIPLPSEILDKFSLITPVQFQHKSSKRIDLGFIAEDTAKIDPKFTSWGPNYKFDEETQTYTKEIIEGDFVPSDINDRALLSLTIAKIQQLEGEIQKLKAELDTLKNK